MCGASTSEHEGNKMELLPSMCGLASPHIGAHNDGACYTTMLAEEDSLGNPERPHGPDSGRTLKRTSSYTFKRAFFRAYIAKHVQDPNHLGTVIEGSCPFVQDAASTNAGSIRAR
jgi:hypothetical protein